MIYKFIYISVIVLLAALVPSRTSHFNSHLNLIYSLIYFLVIFVFLFQQKRLTKNWFRFDVLFLIGYTIVHIQIPTLASIGIEPTNPEFVWINKDLVNFATWLSVIAITFWIWGYSTYKSKKTSANASLHVEKKQNHLIHDILLSTAFVSFLISAGPSVLSGTYNDEIGWGAGAAYVYLALCTLLYLRIIYFFKNIKGSANISRIFKQLVSQRIFFIILLSFIAIFLLSGDRGPVIHTVILIFGAYAFFIKPISLKTLIALITISAFVLTIVGLGRVKDVSDFNNQNIFERGYSSFTEADNSSITGELANSNRILYIALDTVPDKHPYLNGITYLVNIAGTIPFLSGIIVNTFDIPRLYRGTSLFFTTITLGENPSWGVGSEVIADIYVNFGIYGVFILMFLFGRFSSTTFEKAIHRKNIYLFIYFSLLMFSLSINRGMLLYPLPQIAYFIIFHYLIKLINKWLFKIK